MITKVVTSIWKETKQVAVNEKYIKQAKKKKQDLEIIVGRQRMFIKVGDLDLKVNSKSAPIQDKFSSGTYKLWYFNWRPETKEDEEKRMCGY